MTYTPFYRLFEAIHRWWIRRQTLRQLSSLTDHALQDIGLSRQDIDPAVEAMMREPDTRPGRGRRRRIPADAGPSLSSPGFYRWDVTARQALEP